MDIKQQINQIIQKRKAKAEVLSAQREEFSALLDDLKKINALEMKKREITNDAMRKEFILKFDGLGLKEAMRQADELMKEYNDVIKRMSKDYISIATVGKERQGKSQFLQSVSKLGDDVIPAYDAGSCTGATSIIVNDYNIPDGQLRAIITYKKRDDLVTLVREYVRTIETFYPIDEIEFDNIKFLPVSYLKEQAGNDAEKLSAYRHLENIVINFDAFSDCFGMGQEVYTNPEDIKKIVAQNNGKGAEDTARENYYKYLAVSKAEIACRFYYDAGKIRLIDTIGIESTQAGVEQAMLDTVRSESDAAIVVTRPIAAPQKKDIEIYQELMSTLEGKLPEKWLFYLVNHFKGQNDHTVSEFNNGIAEWGLAGHMIVDCSNEEAVNNEFMRTVLETLLSNIDDIDRVYMAQLDEKLNATKTKMEQLIRYIDSFDAHSGGIVPLIALEQGKKLFNKMGVELRKIVKYYHGMQHNHNGVLARETQRILDTLDTDIIPDAATIQDIADNNNKVGNEVWIAMLNYVRNEITRRFVNIDDVLAVETIRFKNSLVKAFYDNLSQLFGEFGENDDSVDMVKRLRELMEEIIADDERYAQIYETIVFLDNFSFNTRAAIIQTVRSHLGIINPLSDGYASPSIDFSAFNCGEQIHYYLTSRISLIEENLRQAFLSLYSTPNQAFYAVAEEFYDKMTYAATDISEGRIVNMEDVWGYFFQTFCSLIWSKAAQESAVLNELNTEIKALRPALESCIKVIGG